MNKVLGLSGTKCQQSRRYADASDVPNSRQLRFDSNEGELLSQLGYKGHRFRQQDILASRGAGLTDLTDPGLGLIKRKILERTSRSFGTPLLPDVIFNDFLFLEQ